MNALVKDWLSGFLMRHMTRFPGDWPRDDIERAEHWKLWHSALSRNEVREDEADDASARLGEAPPSFRRDHIPAVLQMVKMIRCEKGAGSNEVETRDSARLASKDCTHCGGEGITVVWHPRPDPAHGIPRTVPAYCDCRHGRWIMRNHKTRPETQDVAKGYVDFAMVHHGESAWLQYPPEVDPRFRQENPR